MLNRMIKELNLKEEQLGLSVHHLQTGESYSINGDVLFQTASTIKVPILWSLFKQIDKGTISLNDKYTIVEEDFVPGSGVLNEFVPGLQVTIKDLATLMIIVSDNTATDILLKLIGKNNVEKDMRHLGLENTYVRQTIWELLCISVGMNEKNKTKETYEELIKRLHYLQVDKNSIVFTENIENNVMSPNDMTELLKIIYEGKELSKTSRDEIINIMRRQHFTHRISKYLPPEVKVASKTGSLFTVANDVGIIELPNNQGAYVISAFVRDSNEAAGSEMIAKISEYLFDYFND